MLLFPIIQCFGIIRHPFVVLSNYAWFPISRSTQYYTRTHAAAADGKSPPQNTSKHSDRETVHRQPAGISTHAALSFLKYFKEMFVNHGWCVTG